MRYYEKLKTTFNFDRPWDITIRREASNDLKSAVRRLCDELGQWDQSAYSFIYMYFYLPEDLPTECRRKIEDFISLNDWLFQTEEMKRLTIERALRNNTKFLVLFDGLIYPMSNYCMFEEF